MAKDLEQIIRVPGSSNSFSAMSDSTFLSLPGKDKLSKTSQSLDPTVRANASAFIVPRKGDKYYHKGTKQEVTFMAMADDGKVKVKQQSGKIATAKLANMVRL